MKKISCILMALICIMTSFSAAAAGINNITRIGNSIVVDGSVEYAEGVNKAHIFVLKEGKTLDDLFNSENSDDVMDFVDDISVSPEKTTFSKTIEANTTDNTKVIVAYNGDVTDTLLGEHIYYEGTNIYITGTVTYVDGKDTATIEILGAENAVLYTKTVNINKSNGVYSAFLAGETEVSDENIVKITYNGSSTQRLLKKTEIIKIVEYSQYCSEEANQLALNGYSVMIKLPSGKMSPMDIKNAEFKPNEDGVFIFKGNGTTISSRTPVPFSEFKLVTDPALTARISDDAQGKVYALNLADAGIRPATVTSENISTSRTELYLNNKTQLLSRYPNTGYMRLSGVNVVTADDVTTTTYNYGDARFTEWSSATSAVIEGYIGKDWYIDGADINPSAANTSAKTVSYTNNLPYPAVDNGRIVYRNLLEEIDLPGEWCLDNENQIIYYYIPEGTDSRDVIELSISGTPALMLDSTAKNLWFDGIAFEGSTADAVYMENVNNIKFTNNVFENGNIGIRGNGDSITIENNEFANFKSWAIYYTGGGNSNTYTRSHTKISENYFYNCSYENHDPAVILYGGDALKLVGAEFSHNIIHGSVGSGLRYYGIEVEVSNNEMYNLLRQGADAGVIYSGRSLTQFGGVIKNNYLHDFGPVINQNHLISPDSVHGIYMDDWMSGQSILGNLIVPNNSNYKTTTGAVTFGAYTTAIGNVTIGGARGVRFFDRIKEYGSTRQDIEGAYSSFYYLDGKDAYLAKYPQINELKSAIDKAGNFTMVGNTATDNIGYNLDGFDFSFTLGSYGFHSSTAFANGGTFEKEHKITDKSIFVNADGGDYRVKSSALSGKAYESEYTPTENTVFGFNKGEVSSRFATIYPANGSAIEDGNFTFYWEQARYADSYEYEIATDSSFTNVVKRGTTTERLADIKGLAKGNYYARIKAVNNSVRAGNDWYSDTTAFAVGETVAPSAPDYDITDTSISISGTSATIAYTFVNNIGATGTYKLFAAAYDTDGALRAAKVETVDKATADVSKTFDFDADLTGMTVKAYIWSDETNIIPLTRNITQ